MAATPANIQPQHMLSDNTDVLNITLTPRWTKYLDRTYNLRSAKQRYTPTCSVVIFLYSLHLGRKDTILILYYSFLIHLYYVVLFGIVKVKSNLEQDLKAQRGSRGVAVLFLLTSAVNGIDSAMSSLLYPQERDLVPTVQEAGWAPGPFWMGAENLISSRI